MFVSLLHQCLFFHRILNTPISCRLRASPTSKISPLSSRRIGAMTPTGPRGLEGASNRWCGGHGATPMLYWVDVDIHFSIFDTRVLLSVTFLGCFIRELSWPSFGRSKGHEQKKLVDEIFWMTSFQMTKENKLLHIWKLWRTNKHLRKCARLLYDIEILSQNDSQKTKVPSGKSDASRIFQVPQVDIPKPRPS